jgi:hypothetical protein
MSYQNEKLKASYQISSIEKDKQQTEGKTSSLYYENDGCKHRFNVFCVASHHNQYIVLVCLHNQWAPHPFL